MTKTCSKNVLARIRRLQKLRRRTRAKKTTRQRTQTEKKKCFGRGRHWRDGEDRYVSFKPKHLSSDV